MVPLSEMHHAERLMEKFDKRMFCILFRKNPFTDKTLCDNEEDEPMQMTSESLPAKAKRT